MLENVGRKVTTILVLVVASILFLVLKSPPFQLGLDLSGGTRLVYSIDFDKAYRDGTLDRAEPKVDVLNQIIQIIRNRVDPDGVLEPIIRASGENRIIIELPGTLGVPGKDAKSALGGDLTPSSTWIRVEDAADFPSTGVVRVGSESIRYDDKTSQGLKISGDRPGAQSHLPGTEVTLEKDDAFRARIESLGELSFQIVANAANVPAGVNLTTERERRDEWGRGNPGTPIEVFNLLPEEQGGPHPSLQWVPEHAVTDAQKLAEEYERSYPLLKPETKEETFTGSALSRVYYTQDEFGLPAVGFEIRPERRSQFGSFTGAHEKQQMAIVLNGAVRSAPELEEKLTSGGRISGRFSDEEVSELVTVLRSGSLAIKPRLEDDERVSATLGEDYVSRGQWSALIAVVVVLIFIGAYYRRLGGLAAASLLLSFLMLLGALSFANATLTLPGIAGIILTIGMAVDANILIFDRIREEMDKGRNVKQAAKEGFEKAMPAILDANITTFLTGLILYKIGTGPVRGFAVTLMWGIVTSVFAALVITRVLVHFTLEKGAKEFAMGQWMVKAKYTFLSFAKPALTGSAVAVLAGLALFITTPDADKLGIDFMGGAEAQLRTAKPESLETMRSAIAGLDAIGESSEVKGVADSASGDGFELFRVTFKTAVAGEGELADTDVRTRLVEGLEQYLLQDPITVAVSETTAAGKATATIDLHFSRPYPPDEIAALLTEQGLESVEVTTGEQQGDYVATANVALGRDADEIELEVLGALKNASTPYQLAEGVASYAKVGAQVVGELRDKALLAIAVSLFVIVLYIRVRFAEYSYGYAAVAALLHDVLITLGLLTIANMVGLLNGEISLPMIAAFLTIIGYSLNDTIVIFDRVRENLPRMKVPFEEVLNTSINQTLSRTVLTSFTTFLSVGILYAVNFGTGNVLESFSFAMMIGVLTGTYSTIFVANPVLLWLEKRSGRIGPDGVRVTTGAGSSRPKESRGGRGGEVETAQV